MNILGQSYRKRNKLLVMTILLSGILSLAILAGCAGLATGQQGTGAPPTLVLEPAIIAPGGGFSIFGAGFTPGEKITIRMGVQKDNEMDLSLALTPKPSVGDLGTFGCAVAGGVTPGLEEGVYAVKVIDSQGRTLAVAPLQVKKPAAK